MGCNREMRKSVKCILNEKGICGSTSTGESTFEKVMKHLGIANIEALTMKNAIDKDIQEDEEAASIAEYDKEMREGK